MKKAFVFFPTRKGREGRRIREGRRRRKGREGVQRKGEGGEGVRDIIRRQETTAAAN